MQKPNNDLKVALICGGAGTRMWPMSREDKPKQFQPLLGELSTFQLMVKRLLGAVAPADIFPIASRKYVGLIVQQAPKIPLENIIIEPERRDTLAAVGLSAAILKKRLNDPLVLSVWSDHLVRNDDQFVQAINLARDLAIETDKSIEIAVRPTFANTQLGYLQVGKMVKKPNGLAVFEFVKQIEKPSLEEAKHYVQGWQYLWHIGYSVWRASTMLNLFEKHAKDASGHLAKISKSYGTDDYDKILTENYSKISKTSIDYAVLSKLGKEDQLVISADLGWSDIGMWDVLKDELAKSKEQNVVSGEVYDLDSEDNLIYSTKKGKLIAAIGLKEMIVVDTDDALLVCAKDKSADVKKIIEKLKESDKNEVL